MKAKYRLYERANGVFYVEDVDTQKQQSLKTKDRITAQRLWMAKNEAHKQPAINLQLARAYLHGSDPEVANSSGRENANRQHAPSRFKNRVG